MAYRVGIPGRYIELYVQFKDAAGLPANTDQAPTVTIFDSQGKIIKAQSNIGVSSTGDTGVYSFNYEIPLTAPDGYFADRWIGRIGNEMLTADFAFLVHSSGSIEETQMPTYVPGDYVPWDFDQEEVAGINILLKMLKCRLKNDGVRKVPDGAGGYTEIPCSIFTDDELVCFLVNSLSSFNQQPHFSQFKFSHVQIYTMFADIMIQGALLFALAAQSLIERGREFTITDSGVAYQPPAVSEMLNTQHAAQLADYNNRLKAIKISLPPGPLSVGTFRVTALAPSFMRLRHLRARQIY